MERTSVLAIGIDAAEPALVRRLIEQGALPALESLLEGGTWRRVHSPAHIGSGAVWPTFFTGTSPTEHEVHSHWEWNPETMNLTLYDGRRLAPFWETLVRNGTTVGILDVPFAPFAGLTRGFQVSEWGAHDNIRGRTEVSPEALLDTVEKSTHPFSSGHFGIVGDHRELERLSSACLVGARRRGSLAERLISEVRPELAIVVFPEIHRAEHFLWHTVAPEHPLYKGKEFRKARAINPTLIGLYREVDQQISRLVETVGSGATVLVFSLHGMQPTSGLPNILDPLLCDMGLAYFTGWGAQSWAERTSSTLAAVKRRMPRGLKKLIHQTASWSVRRRLMQQTVLPAYDWSRTRAFSMATDQHGWIRLNLRGREAKGIVPAEHYDETCALIKDTLLALTAQDGRPLVRDMLRFEAPPQKLPDLIVHWAAAAHESPVRIKDTAIEAYPRLVGTGQHAFDGFCIKSPAGEASEPVAAKDLHRLIVDAVPGNDEGTAAC